MSNKFTGITSGGDNIPVYDKAAHQALSSKLDASALAPAISGKADTSAIPSLDGYATEQWVGEQGYLTAVPEGYATTEDVISATSGLQPSGDYASASDLANYQPVSSMTAYQAAGDYLSGNALDSLSGTWETVTAKADTTALEAYQTIEGMSAYQPVGSYLSANALDSVSGDWNEVSAKLDTTAFSDVSGSFLTSVPDTYLQNTDLTIVDNKVTEISGVELSAGTSLEFEYDSADNISAINSSAISTTPSQALYAKSPLYAGISGTSSFIGIETSAISADLARMMGVDETVLWSGSGHNTVTSVNLSESWKNFNQIKIYGFSEGGSLYCEFNTEDMINAFRKEAVLSNGGFASWKSTNFYVNVSIPCYFDDDNTVSSTSAKYVGYWNNAWQAQTLTFTANKMTKIVGIGRKS